MERTEIFFEYQKLRMQMLDIKSDINSIILLRLQVRDDLRAKGFSQNKAWKEAKAATADTLSALKGMLHENLAARIKLRKIINGKTEL